MTDMLEQIRSLGDQLRWAASQAAPRLGTHSDVLFAGMGGSGIAGDYAAAVAVPSGVRVTVHKGYGPLPAWTTRQRPLVIVASYSGNTEETLDVAEAAFENGLQTVVITTGGALGAMAERRSWPTMPVPPGMQPRAAAGYMIGATLRVLEGARAIDDQAFHFGEAARIADEAVAKDSVRWALARRIADGLAGRITVVYGGGPVSAVAAQRWKTQINENAKMPAWWSALPELDHNEIVGWEALPELTREAIGVVALTDRSDHPRIRARLDHTSALTADAVPWVGEVAAEGVSVLARLVSLTVVGDLVSWMLADSAGVDPVPVATIEQLKKLLVEEKPE